VIIVKTDVTKARAKLIAMGRNVRRTLPEVLESEGRIVAISLAKSTQPFGTGADAQNMGERAVSRDIKKVYVTIGDVFDKLPISGTGDARQFWKLIKLGRYDAAQDILTKTGSNKFGTIPIGRFDAGALHRQARNATTGRVSQKSPSLIVTDGNALIAYGLSKVNLVGTGKSAWADIARQLGGTRGLRAPKLPGGERDITANWITRKRGPSRIDRDYGNQSRPILTLTSAVSYADNILSQPARNNAVRIAHGRIIKQCAIAAKYEARQAMRHAA
jgi:hypothetical protein